MAGATRRWAGAVGIALLLQAGAGLAAGACVVAKRLGDSLAYELLTAPAASPRAVIDEAERRLLAQGFDGRYEGVFTQASSPLEGGIAVVVRTRYTTLRGRTRTSYGCAFDAASAAAERAALRNLETYSWGWRPELGYEVVERRRF